MITVITGASRGIGLELTHQRLQKGDAVFAFARAPEAAPELQALKMKFSGALTLAPLDLNHDHFTDEIVRRLKQVPAVDLLINNAGVYHEGETLPDFLNSFQVNSVAPFLITRALLPQLKKSAKPIAAHITSLMGSISDNQSGGSYAYRASKSALNMISKTIAQDEPWLISVVIHPGWVQTRMGGAEAPTTVSESAAGILNVISGLSSLNSGQFFDFEGDHLPW